MGDKTYFLSSLDSIRFEPVRECHIIRRMSFPSGNECALIRLVPPVNGQPWGAIGDMHYFVLANRHEGEHLFPISGFPCFVHVAHIE